MNFYETKNIATFGVAGNFTGHLEQAGEAADFINLKVQDKSAPKGVFPTFHDAKTRANLFIFIMSGNFSPMYGDPFMFEGL